MGKIKTSARREESSLKHTTKLKLEDFSGLERVNPLEGLADPEQTATAIFECLLNNDPEGVMEMLESYLEAVNKANMMKKSNFHKSTMYSALKHRNPTIKTLAKIISSVCREGRRAG